MILMVLSAQNVSAQQRNNSFSDKEWVRIYPNPVVSDATISISSDVDLEKAKISIVFYNIVGKEVFRLSNIKDYDVRINREGFVPGIYIYQMKVDEKVQSTGRISFR